MNKKFNIRVINFDNTVSFIIGGWTSPPFKFNKLKCDIEVDDLSINHFYKNFKFIKV